MEKYKSYLEGIKAKIREYMDSATEEDSEPAYDFLCESVTDTFYIFYGVEVYRAALCGVDFVLYGDKKELPRTILELRNLNGKNAGLLKVEDLASLQLDEDMAEALMEEVYRKMEVVAIEI